MRIDASVAYRGLMRTPRLPNTAIKDVREVLGLSQEEFGRPAGLTQSVVARLESGAVHTSWEHARRLGEAYGRDPQDFFPSESGFSFSPDDDAELAARAAAVARRLAGDDDRMMVLVAGLAFAFLDLGRRGQPISDDESTLSRIESVLRRFKAR